MKKLIFMLFYSHNGDWRIVRREFGHRFGGFHLQGGALSMDCLLLLGNELRLLVILTLVVLTPVVMVPVTFFMTIG